MKTITGLNDSILDKRGTPIPLNAIAEPKLTDVFLDVLTKSVHADPKDVLRIDRIANKVLDAERNSGVLELEDYEFELLRKSVLQIQGGAGFMVYVYIAIGIVLD